MESINQFAQVAKEYLKSPCATCGMIASLHSATPKEFDYNCSQEKSNVCRQLYIMERVGHPGARGWTGGTNPTPEELEVMRRQDQLVSKAWWSQYRQLRQLFEELD